MIEALSIFYETAFWSSSDRIRPMSASKQMERFAIGSVKIYAQNYLQARLSEVSRQ